MKTTQTISTPTNHGIYSTLAKSINLENFGWGTFYVVFERGAHDSCDEEDDSLGVAEFSFKVVVT